LFGFGVPGRLAIDIAWLAASGYLAYALRNLTGARWVAALAFALLAFHPYGIFIFDRALSETLLTVLCAFALAGFIEAWNCHGAEGRGARKLIAFIAITLAFAAAYHTRKEGIVLVAPLAILAACSIVNRRTWWSERGWRELAFPLLILP